VLASLLHYQLDGRISPRITHLISRSPILTGALFSVLPALVTYGYSRRSSADVVMMTLGLIIYVSVSLATALLAVLLVDPVFILGRLER